MGSTRKNIITATKLQKVAQSLELGRINDLHTQRVHGNMTMDRVIEYLKQNPSLLVCVFDVGFTMINNTSYMKKMITKVCVVCS